MSDLYDELERVLAHVGPERQAELWESLKMSELVDGLKQAIADSGLTHYAIGKASGVDTAVIDRFVSGERDIRLETAGRLAESLGYRLSKAESAKPARAAATKTMKRSTPKK